LIILLLVIDGEKRVAFVSPEDQLASVSRGHV
jgi:hypothetical protein